ncbi:hypothetical protein BAE44_0010383, partial [Dichanthelium oligosanthes]
LNSPACALLNPDCLGSCDERTLQTVNVTGKVVLCSAPWDSKKGLNDTATRIAKAGAKGLIFAQHNSNLLVALDRGMPCVLVDFEIAHRITAYAASTRTPVVRISPTVSVIGNGVLSPRVAAFSSRGPSAAFPAIIKDNNYVTYMGQLYQLNLPSIAVPDLKGSVTVLRTVTNVDPEEAAYSAVVEAPAGVDVSVEPSVIKVHCR